MKKALSLVLVLVMLVSTLSMLVSADFIYDADENKHWVPTNAEWNAVEKGTNVVARFIVGADIHMDHYNSYAKLQNAYDVSKQIGGVDALMIAGDLTHYGSDEEYAPLVENINKNTTANAINPNATGNSVGATILSMGNHDFGHTPAYNGKRGSADFTRNTGMEACALYWVNGVPVIALSPSDGTRSPSQVENGKEFGNNYDGRVEFVQQSYAAIDATGYTGPILVIAHHRTPSSNIGKIIDGSKGRNEYYPTEILKEFRDHPNTILFTGHSHTWINDMGSFILQNNNGFTHVRAGTLGNDYGNSDGGINAYDGINESIVKDYINDLNCSAVLVDVMADGTAQLRALDLAKGEYIFDEVFTIDPKDVDYYNTSANKAGTYSEDCQAPSFAADAASKITVEDLGNNSSIIVSFPEATPATSSAKDAIDYYFIRIADSKGNVVEEDGMGYVKTPNYRHSSKKGTPFEVKINSLAWDTDYTVTIWAENSYGLKSQEIVYNGTINVGHGVPTYPAKPVYDVDYSYGTQKDAQKHAIITTTNPLSKIVDDTTIAQKTMQFTKFGKATSIGYDFQDADYRRIMNGYVLECYFNTANVNAEQALCGAWTGARLAFKINGGKVILYADYLSRNETQREVASAHITANTWYHVVAVYDGLSTKLYLNGELRATENGCSGGLKTSYSPPSDDPDAEDEAVKDERILFCVGSMDNSTDGDMYPVQNAKINKVALYEGVMTADDVALAYKIAKSNTGFTDVSDTWYIDSVEYAKAAGLMSGTGNGTTFEPNTKTTRAMIVQLLYALEGSPSVEYKSIYTDVTTKHWAKKAITWASENGIAYGSGGKFNPDTVVTREQVAVFLYRYLKSKNVEMIEGADLSVFPDENKISTYGDLKDAMKWANAAGIVNGKAKNDGKTYLAPQDSATRAEAATMIVSFHKQFAGAIK